MDSSVNVYVLYTTGITVLADEKVCFRKFDFFEAFS